MRTAILWQCFLLLGASAPAWAGPCGLLPEGKARVVIDRREMNIDSATRLDPCQGKLRLTEGKAVLTFVRRANQNEYRTLKLKEVVDLDALAGEGTVSVPLDRIIAFFRSGRQIEAVTAMSRAGERITGFPYDDILAPRQAMQLRLLEWHDRLKVRDFVLHPRGEPERVMLHVGDETDAIDLPAGLLAEGRDYTWVAVLSDGEQYIGKFRTLSREQAQRVEQQLAQIDGDDSLGEITRRTLRALLLDQNRLSWNRDVTLATITREK